MTARRIDLCAEMDAAAEALERMGGENRVPDRRDHKAALAEIDACWGAAEGTEKADKLDVLLALVDIYEAKRWPIETDESLIRSMSSTMPLRSLGTLRQSLVSF